MLHSLCRRTLCPAVSLLSDEVRARANHWGSLVPGNTTFVSSSARYIVGRGALIPSQPAVTAGRPHADSEDLSSLLATESEPILKRKVLANLLREEGRHC